MSGTRIRHVSRKVRQRRTIVGGAAALLAAAIMTNSGLTLASWTDSEQLDGGNGDQQVGSGECTVDTTGLASSSWSRFLSGEIGTTDLAEVAGVQQLTVTHAGTATTGAVGNGNPLGDDAFDSDITAELGQQELVTLGLEVANAATTGAYTQWAQARNNGRPYAATGAVTDDGAVELENPDSTPPAVGVLRLSDLLALGGQDLANSVAQLADLELTIGAIDSNIEYYGCEQVWKTPVAELENGYFSRDGRISDLNVAFVSPAVSSIYTGTTGSLDATQLERLLTDLQGDADAALGGLVGQLNTALTGLLQAADPNDPAYVRINTHDTTDLLAELQAEVSSDDLSIDLARGTVAVDLAELTGATLRDPAPNTVVLGSTQMAQIDTELQQAITDRISRLEQLLTEFVGEITIDIHVPVTVNVDLSALGVVANVKVLVHGDDVALDDISSLAITPTVTLTPNLGGLDAAANTLLQPVLSQITGALSDVVTQLGPQLQGDVDEVFASTYANLDTLLTTTTSAIGDAVEQIAPLVRITANVQPTIGATDDLAPHDGVPTLATVSALRIEVLDAAGGTALADVWLATSGVGPVASVNQ